MRCKACNKELTDYESTKKSVNTGEYIDLCTHCFSSIKDEILYIDRPDLADYEEIETELEGEFE